MDELAIKFLKTYQVWHHRRLLLQLGALGSSPAIELVFIAEGLSKDEKNYHTWAYRQWVLAHFNRDELWAGELPFVEEMLEIDVRNNSAWNHRFFVVFSSGVRTGDEDREKVVQRELAFAKEKIALAPNNMSAWNYLRSVLDYSVVPFSQLQEFVKPYAEVSQSPGAEDSVVDLDNPKPSPGADLPCPAAIEFLADIHEAAGGEAISEAVTVCDGLLIYNQTLIFVEAMEVLGQYPRSDTKEVRLIQFPLLNISDMPLQVLGASHSNRTECMKVTTDSFRM